MAETRTQIQEILERKSNEYLAFRFSQLASAIAHWAIGPSASAVYDVEDEAFLAAAQRNLAFRAHRRMEDMDTE
jgi:hypothetical protein